YRRPHVLVAGDRDRPDSRDGHASSVAREHADARPRRGRVAELHVGDGPRSPAARLARDDDRPGHAPFPSALSGAGEGARQELAATASDDAPLEVRAEHAYRAGEPMSALLLLERMGDAALMRGDPQAAVLAFRRGLDLARRELMISGDDALERAMVSFSRKL